MFKLKKNILVTERHSECIWIRLPTQPTHSPLVQPPKNDNLGLKVGLPVALAALAGMHNI